MPSKKKAVEPAQVFTKLEESEGTGEPMTGIEMTPDGQGGASGELAAVDSEAISGAQEDLMGHDLAVVQRIAGEAGVDWNEGHSKEDLVNAILLQAGYEVANPSEVSTALAQGVIAKVIRTSQFTPAAETLPEPDGVIITGFGFLSQEERDGIESFLEDCLRQLQSHDEEKAVSWMDLSPDVLVRGLRDQHGKLIDAALRNGDPKGVRKRAAHVANYAMMLHATSLPVRR